MTPCGDRNPHNTPQPIPDVMDEAPPETRETASQAIAMAEDLLKHVDLERLGGYASAATAALVRFRRHPWLMVAVGATLAAVGAWQISRSRREAEGDDEDVTASNGYLESSNESWSD